MTISDEELFRLALQNLDPGDMYGAKFGEPDEITQVEKGNSDEKITSLTTEPNALSYDNIPVKAKRSDKSIESSETTKPGLSQKRKAKKAPHVDLPEENPSVDTFDFAHMLRYEMDKIVRHDNSKYYEQKPTQVTSKFEEEPLKREIVTEPLPTDDFGLRNTTLMKNQRELLVRYQQAPQQLRSEINIRKLKLGQALSELKEEVEYVYRKRIRFLRIVTGKGHHSVHKIPVIKKEVILWLEQVGYMMIKGYAPELEPSGDYGSIVVEVNERDELF